MPRIHKNDIRGMSLQDLVSLMMRARLEGTYPESDLDKVMRKINKRINQGETLVTDDLIDDIDKDFADIGGFD